MQIINLGILAHVDAGKTTVTEGLLVHSGAKRAPGRVDDGTTTTDSMALEQQRGMTIRAATVSFPWKGHKINLIDTPGHMDFIAEVERSLSVLDGVILVISAKEGVQPQTRVLFHKLMAMEIPVILYLNKIDRAGVSLEAAYADIRARLTDRFVPMQRAEGEGTRSASVHPLPLASGPLRETIIERSDTLLAAYLEDAPISAEQCGAALQAMVRSREAFPLYLGSALHDIGVKPLLDAVTGFFAGSGDPAAPLSAYVYKVQWDAHGHKLAYLRLFAGTLRLREWVPLAGSEARVRVTGLLAAQDGRFVPTEQLGAGDIGVLLDAPLPRCGSFLGRVTARHGTQPAQPLLATGVSPLEGASRSALLDALTQLTEEDPFLRMSIHPGTGEITLQLFGLLQREILEALLWERFHIKAAFSPVQTLFKEQPREKAAAYIPIWAAGNLHEAGIALTVEPLPPGTGNQYETAVSFGDLTRTFQNGVSEGVQAGLLEGLGHEIVDTKVTFTGMDFSSVTSTPSDYRRLAPQVLKRALEAAGLRRLEPWLAYTVTAPLDFQRRVLQAVGKLRATMEAVDYTETDFTARGEVPLDSSKEFGAALLSMTRGQGIFETRFLEYRETSGQDTISGRPSVMPPS